MSFEKECRVRLNDNLKNYTKIYLISAESMEQLAKHFDKLPEEVFDSIMIMTTDAKYARLTSVKIIDQREYDVLRDLYMTYEFSDRFRLIEDTDKYGVIKNYVKAGIVTATEAVRATFG